MNLHLTLKECDDYNEMIKHEALSGSHRHAEQLTFFNSIVVFKAQNPSFNREIGCDVYIPKLFII
jgi:hypothetical protein